ncbi:MAG TPA: ligase-associated DNA damage response endonuclease PdeM [Azospirillaceae bacterium]|nr:ligase-associated DNA damage response endonuclease PdeM [Azospirillaceae bacterium]
MIPLHLNGITLLPDPSGALVWREQSLVVVADLHLEKGSAFAARGRMLPPYDTRATLDRLETALKRLGPARVICLGDSTHDVHATERMAKSDHARLAVLTAAHDWVWVAGNHDPTPPADWGGRVEVEVALGPLVFRHEAQAGAMGEVSGHYHPVAAVRAAARRVRARCFVGDGQRLILPAFGAYTGGLNVLDPAMTRLLGRDFHAYLLGEEKVHKIACAKLVPDRR